MSIQSSFLRWQNAAAACCIAIGVPGAAYAAPDSPSQETLFRNVRIFNGSDPVLSAPSDVLVKDGVIACINDVIDGVASAPAPGRTVIEGAGRVLMPGLIDAHWHVALAGVPMQLAMSADIGYLTLLNARVAKATLMRGFTTVRDAGGPSAALKRAIDEGLIEGPRIFPSGAMISQSGGHGDFRQAHEVPRQADAPLSDFERKGAAVIADGPDEVRRRAREQLMLGASQIKLMAGGGVSSRHDPIDVSQYTEAEFRAAVEAAENWGTYVMVHAYTPRAVQAAVAAGVKVIEHGQLIDDDTARLIAKKGVWLSMQPFLDNGLANVQTGAARAKQLQVAAGTDRAYALAKKYGIKTAWGTDILFDSKGGQHQGQQLAAMQRWYGPGEVLRMATADNASLLSLSGLRNPYYPGQLGVVKTGALADLLLVDGNPLEQLDLVADPDRNFMVIMKGGRIHKNLIRP